MTYKIPDTKTADKDEIVKHIEDYLNSGNSLAFINDLLYQIAPETHRHTNVARDIAYKMKATGKYELKEEPIISGGARYFISKIHIPEKSWTELHPIRDKIRTALITGFVTLLVSLIVGIILFQFQNRGQGRLDDQQDKRLDSLSQKVDNLLNNQINASNSDTAALKHNPKQ